MKAWERWKKYRHDYLVARVVELVRVGDLWVEGEVLYRRIWHPSGGVRLVRKKRVGCNVGGPRIRDREFISLAFMEGKEKVDYRVGVEWLLDLVKREMAKKAA